MRALRIICLALSLSGLTVPGLAQEQDPNVKKDGPAQASVFDRPAIEQAVGGIAARSVAMIQARQFAAAEKLLEEALKRPELDRPVIRYNLACVLSLQAKVDESLEQLEKAVRTGFLDLNHIEQDTDLVEARKSPKYADIRKLVEDLRAKQEQAKPPEVAPRKVEGGIAEVGESNTIYNPQFQMLISRHEFPPPDPSLEISRQKGPVGDLLRQWAKEGTAAGLNGFLYDNHDRDHSNMAYGNFPQLTRVEYAEAAKKRNLDFGIQVLFAHSAPVIGNASVAMTSGPFWRSMSRLGVSEELTARKQLLHYLQNHLYFYPEHADHDEKFGDVFHANTPFVVTSQGSSGSDREFMDACADAAAALRPETQQKILKAGLLAPTLQMILRRSMKGIDTPEDYLSGKAHPSAFDGKNLDPERMVKLAHSILPGEIPPLVPLVIEKEGFGRPGVDYFDVGPSEAVFTTPVAISRMIRSVGKTKVIQVTAGKTEDPNKLPLTFEWKLLRGDPKNVRIKTSGSNRESAIIEVDWSTRRPIDSDPTRTSFRVDIGVFAFNGKNYSAPSFISFAFPQCEERTYDADGRILSVVYRSSDAPETYTDPMIYTPREWKDEYHYSADHLLKGWTRTRGKETEEFSPQGLLVRTRDDKGRPAEVTPVAYVRDQSAADVAPKLRQLEANERFVVEYASDRDLSGKVAPKK